MDLRFMSSHDVLGHSKSDIETMPLCRPNKCHVPTPDKQRLLAKVVCSFMTLAFLAQLGLLSAQSLPSRPILFAHGFCGSAFDFEALNEPLYQHLPSNLYPSSTIYYVFYDSIKQTTTFSLLSGGLLVPIPESSIPSSTRFFSIEFYNPNTESTDPTSVASVSILNKAYELSQVIKQITSITNSKSVIIVAHSMGGLDARAYVENLASPGFCYQNNTPDYSLPTCTPGSGNAAFAGDVAQIVTVDTPHPGDSLAELSLGPFGPCWAQSSTNKTEQKFSSQGGPGLVESLNYSGATVAGVVPSLNPAPINAVQDYFSDVTSPWDNYGGWLTGYSDDVVLVQEQSILENLPSNDTRAPLRDINVSYLSSDAGINSTTACFIGRQECLTALTCPVLHFMTCLAAQPSTQNAIVAQVLTYSNSAVATLSATSVGSTDAKLNGTVNPNSANGHAYFYWATDPNFNRYTAVDCGAVTANNETQRFTAQLNQLSIGLAYFVEMVFWDTDTSTYQYGEVSSFTTGAAPTVTTTAATGVTGSGATLNGTANPHGANGQYQFVWGTDPTLTTGTFTSCAFPFCPAWVANSQSQAFQHTLTGLPSATTYYYRTAGDDLDNSSSENGAILSFTTQ